MPLHRPSLRLAVVVVLSLPALVHADVWVFEPSAAIDQRFDNNYTIDPDRPDKVSATRVVGTLGLSREAPAAKFSGLIRVDGLVTQSDEQSSELSSNQVLFLNSEFNSARTVYGIGFNLKRDTPSRDIAADLTDIASVAADTGASVTQDDNVARTRLLITPNWKYNLTRRTTLEAGLDYTQVQHELPTATDVLTAKWLEGPEALAGAPFPNPITIDDTGFFTIDDELDDYKETAFNVALRTKLTPITTLSFFAGYSDYVAESEPDRTLINIPFEDLIEDDEVKDIRRLPKRETRSNTAKFRVGYDRAFTQTLNLGFQVGIFTTEIDDSDLIRDTDVIPVGSDPGPAQARLDEARANRVSSTDGWLASVSATKNAGITRYSFKFGVDVLPSDIGSQVESLEAVGILERELGPLLDFSFRIRAYEPDRLDSKGDDDFSRRFLSMEPKLIWRFSRAWTTAASLRYRRQKSQADTGTGVSNAVLFSLKYTPPSAIRDAELNR